MTGERSTSSYTGFALKHDRPPCSYRLENYTLEADLSPSHNLLEISNPYISIGVHYVFRILDTGFIRLADEAFIDTSASTMGLM